MPQMAPISWLILFIIFSMTLTMFCISNYFIIMPNTPISEKWISYIPRRSLYWKW